MLEPAENNRPRRLSISPMRHQPRRAFTDAEITVLRRVADSLILANINQISGSHIGNFVALTTKAAMIYDAQFEVLESLLAELSHVSYECMWDYLRKLNEGRASEFYLLSTIIVAAYIYSDEIKQELKYPTPHQNPASMFEIADELSSGILDPVIERGPIFVDEK